MSSFTKDLRKPGSESEKGKKLIFYGMVPGVEKRMAARPTGGGFYVPAGNLR